MTYTTHKTLEAMLEALKALKQDMWECHPNRGPIQLKSYVRWVDNLDSLSEQINGILKNEVAPRITDVKRDKRAQAAQSQEVGS